MSLKSVVLLFFAVAVTSCQPKKETKMDSTKTSSKKPYAVIETSMGTIEAELFESATPRTVQNFVGLAEKGYYNGIIFHRVIDGFMIQGGDPTGTGSGGQSVYGAPFQDEFVDTLRHTNAGILSMANAGPNTNGSQFFITLVPTPWLDGHHTVFGKVTTGMEVVQAIGKVKTAKPSDRPIEQVAMKTVTIVRK